MAKRKVTRSSSVSSEASEQSSSQSDTEQSSHGDGAGASGSAETSDDSESDPEVTLNKLASKSSPAIGKKTTSKEPAKRGRVASTKRGKKDVLARGKKSSNNRGNLSSEDESMGPTSTAVSSAAVSPTKNTTLKTITKKPANGARPNTRQRGGTNVRRSRHVTGRNASALMDTDSDSEMPSTANESVASSPRKKSGRGRSQKSTRNEAEKIKASSFSGDDSQGEEGSNKKSSLAKDRVGPGEEPSISATNITDRLLVTHNLERQNSSPSREVLPTINRVPLNVNTTQSSTAHGNGPYHTGMTLPPVRRTFEGCTPMEERKCPTPSCDSTGHLSGSSKLDRHFTQEACPLYHNMIKKDCRDFRSEINKKHAARRKANNIMAGARSPLGSPSVEQKRHSQMVS